MLRNIGMVSLLAIAHCVFLLFWMKLKVLCLHGGRRRAVPYLAPTREKSTSEWLIWVS